MTLENNGPRTSRSNCRLDRSRTEVLSCSMERDRIEQERNNLRSELGTRIRGEFPSIPRRKLKAMVDYYTDPDFRSPHQDRPGLRGEWREKIFSLVRAWIRHQMTDYDEVLASTGIGGAQNKKKARELVDDDVRAIIESWKKIK